MPRKRNGNKPEKTGAARRSGGVSLKQLAEHLELSTTTLSLVLNDAPSAVSIPRETKERIFNAAKELNYRPNYLARSLRVQRTHTLGVIVPDLSDGYSAMVLGGVEAALSQEGYFYITASHMHHEELLEKMTRLLIERQIEGLISVATPIPFKPELPVVSISGHKKVEGVTNLILNHEHAAELGVGHLYNLGHRRIALIKGQANSADTEVRWRTINAAAVRRGIAIDPNLTVQLDGDVPTPEIGYSAIKKILATGEKFTAVFAFNDISAIGAIRALEEMGLRVPTDVSVLGFDDIYAAAFHNPALTTIRQPLFEMGSLAAQTLLNKLAGERSEQTAEELSVEPTLVVRQSTARVSQSYG